MASALRCTSFSVLPSPSPFSAKQQPPTSLSPLFLPLYPSLVCDTTTTTAATSAVGGCHNPRSLQEGWCPQISPASSLLLDDVVDGEDLLASGLGPSVLAVAFPALAYADVLWSKAGCYNVQVVVREDETEESLLRRFRREVSKAGVIPECKRRKFFEDSQARRKRKTREAAKKNRRRRPRPRYPPPDQDEASKSKKDEAEEEDNWELPEGELPY